MSERYAVFGNPVAHSKSPLIHLAFARQTGQDLTYEAILAPLDGFATAAKSFAESGGYGANVTLPFKEDAFRLATRLSERAAAAAAVNTLKFDQGEILGENTDGIGLMHDIRDNLQFSLSGKRILLLGAGGAARGVILPLLAETPASLTVANRTLKKAEDLRDHFSSIEASSYAALSGRQFDLVVNATSTGLSDELPPLPEDIFAEGALAYDMMYGRETPFMRFARAHQATVADGLGMLVEQAAEAFFIWHGVRPHTAPVIAQLRG
jgi:shikimate dehydrogenase